MMMSQHCFMQGLGAFKREAITRANVYPGQCHNITSIGTMMNNTTFPDD